MVTLVQGQLIPQILGDHEEGEISEAEKEEEEEEDQHSRINSGSDACCSHKLQTIDPGLFDTVENYINNVTVTNACKSVNDACGNLHDALVILAGLSSAASQPVSALVSKIVDKIRIVYCVYNATADDQKPSVIQSLRKLASLYSDRLFTPIQLLELKSLSEALKQPEEPEEQPEEPETDYGYLPWDGDSPEKQPVLTSSELLTYGSYMSSPFPVDDLPSPTPSDEDVAARYGKTGVSINEKPTGTKREASPTPEVVDSKRQKLDDFSGGWLDPDVNEGPKHTILMEKQFSFVEDTTLNTSSPLPGSPEAEQPSVVDDDIHPELLDILNGLDESERDAILKERQRRLDEQTSMFDAKKLCLVLDLDLTLLNSAKFNEIEPEWEQHLRAAECIERARDGKDGPRRELYRSTYMSMWTKLRPGIWRFLARASQLYELHLYTMGNKAYATEMAKLLDPTGVLFAGRVISKGDDGDALYGDERTAKTKDLDGVLGMESGVLIVDDSLRVWPHHKDNLILVERYLYFPCSRRQFGIPGPSLLEVGHDEREADGMLASVLGAIERVHREFYARPNFRDTDVREILFQVQRSVLAGCKLVFSRVFPVDETEPHRHRLWLVAQQYGAICTTVLEDDVTHVVAVSMGTDKSNWALSTGRHLVSPGWLEASALLYRRANEREFPVPP